MRRSMKGKDRLSRRITWRVIMIMLFFNVLIIGAILAFVFTYSLANCGMRGQYVTDGIGGRMESMVKAVKIAARNNVAEVEDHLDSPEKVFDALEHELRLNNHYIGFAAAFVPDYYPSQGRWFERMWTLGKHILQIQVEVFHAVAATAENGEDSPYNLAVLIANQRTAKSQVGVDYRGQNTVKFVQNEKYSA